jgi:NAD(P)-dependent dehydrogenase (short-subunit alcohol dehydrogenase family)
MKNAIIWGAAGGIGKALTQKLTSENFTVVAISRQIDEMSLVTTYTIHADVTQPLQVAEAARIAGEVAEGFDLYVYAVGDITYQKISEMSSDQWDRILAANLTGVFLTTQASLSLLRSGAYMVFLGAVHERLRLPGLSAYAAAKAGLEVFVEILRKETRHKTLIIRPGAVNTALWSKVPFSLPKTALQPEALAEKIYSAIIEGKEGVLDL